MQDSHSLFSRFKSLSGVALIIGFLLVVAGPGLLWTDWLNNQMFRLGTTLLPEPEAVKNVRLIQLPADAYSNPEGISQIRYLLKKLNRANAAGVAVVLKPLPSLDYQLKETDKKQTKPPSDNEEPWELTRGELNKLAWSLQAYEVDVGIVTQPSQTDYYSFPEKNYISEEDLTYLDRLQRFQYSDLNLINQKNTGMQYSYPRYPVSVQLSTVNKPLIWFEANDFRYTPDLVLRLYSHLQKDQNIDWLEDKGLQLAAQIIKTDNQGMVLEYYSELTGNDANITTLTLEQALARSSRSFRNTLVIIADDRYHLSVIGNSLANLVSGAIYHKPVWSQWMVAGCAALVLLFALIVLPRIRKETGYLLTFILILVALIAQYVLLIIHAIWVPLLAVLAYLVFAHFIIQLKRINDSRLDHLRLQMHEAFFHLGQYQYDQGDHEKAILNLLKCRPTDDVVEMLYEIGLGLERRRQYDKALQLFSDINIRKPNYRDVKKRLQSLTSVATHHVDVFSPGATQKTLVLGDIEIELPTLGRYELEKELGRGAMGVVYLGKDPKINRLVAIKTLDYSQFSDKEIKSIKSRFFREAEAAGRLSHPNIVTVYDVGDEEDFAFIAMDYVPGVSLGEYTHADNLLPINDVYKITAAVAETLDYAHNQNIVHRDIKPSNIMYNPDDGQMKVTDFGIARITDSVRTRTGSFMGSPSYMSPEQMTGSNVDGQSDIYALGVSFYQLLTGVLPFEADNLGNLAYKITHEKHKPIRDLRPDLPSSATRIVNKCLQKKPENRYSNGLELASALKRGMPREE